MAMTDEPQVWHYGLMAERGGEFLHDTPELEFLQQEIERNGQPVLDLCCGAGRLTVPLRRLGIDVDGCDISPDMIQVAGFRDIAVRDGYSDRLATPESEKVVFIARRDPDAGPSR